MSEPLHVVGGLTMNIAAGYATPADSELTGYSAPPEVLTKVKRANGVGEIAVHAERANAVRTSIWNVKSTTQDGVNDLIQAVEQELAACDAVEGKTIKYQYRMGDASTTNFDDIESGHFRPKFNWATDGVFWSRGCELTLHSVRPFWKEPFAIIGTTNLMPYAQATMDELSLGDDPVDGYEASGGGTTAITITNTGSPRSGSWHLWVNPDGGAASQGVVLAKSHRMRAIPGKDYVVAPYVKKLDGTPATLSMDLTLIGYNSSGASTQIAVNNANITTTESRPEATFTADADVAFVGWSFTINGTSAEDWFMDEVQVQLGTTATAFSAPAIEIAPDNNFFTDNQASVETDTTGFTVVDGGTGGPAISVTTDEAKFDTSSLEVITTVTAGDGTYSDTPTLDIATMAGKDWTVSPYLKHSGTSPGDDFDITLKLISVSGGTPTTHATTAAHTVTDDWTRPEASATLPAGLLADSLRGQWTKDAGSIETMYVDGQMMEPSASASTFTMPGPIVGQTSVEIPGDVETEISAWLEPVGDFTSEVSLGLHNQNAEGAALLVFGADDDSSGIQKNVSTETVVYVSPARTTAQFKGVYDVSVQLTTTVAASDYSFKWRYSQISPGGQNYDGGYFKAASQVTPQWVNLGVMTIPMYSEPRFSEDDFWSSRIRVVGKKDASSGTVNVWRVVLIPQDNGIVLQNGVANLSDARTLLFDSSAGDSIGYQYFAGGITLPQSWPTVTTDLTTQIGAKFGPLIAGPGTVDVVTLMKENTQSLLKARLVVGCEALYYSPIQ